MKMLRRRCKYCCVPDKAGMTDENDQCINFPDAKVILRRRFHPEAETCFHRPEFFPSCYERKEVLFIDMEPK